MGIYLEYGVEDGGNLLDLDDDLYYFKWVDDFDYDEKVDSNWFKRQVKGLCKD